MSTAASRMPRKLIPPVLTVHSSHLFFSFIAVPFFVVPRVM